MLQTVKVLNDDGHQTLCWPTFCRSGQGRHQIHVISAGRLNSRLNCLDMRSEVGQGALMNICICIYIYINEQWCSAKDPTRQGRGWEFKINSSQTSISPGSKVQHIQVLNAMESLRKVCSKEPFFDILYLHIQGNIANSTC